MVVMSLSNYTHVKEAEMSIGMRPGRILFPISSGARALEIFSYKVRRCMFTSVSWLVDQTFSKVIKT